MNIVLTNDDGYDAPGLCAAFEALLEFGNVYVVAPTAERSACSHTITLRRPITVQRIKHEQFGAVFAVEGTPADCVRLARAVLIAEPIDLVVSGINRGANAGVDTYYSGTVAGAREAAMLGIPAVALSQAVRAGVETDWATASKVCTLLVKELLEETLPGPGFWNVNLPVPIPPDALEHIQRVPVSSHAAPLLFDRSDSDDGHVASAPRGGRSETMAFTYGASYWLREVTGLSDYSVIRDGGIAITAIPLFGRF